MTAEKIKEIANQNIGRYEIRTKDAQNIMNAAESDILIALFYAYKYGFFRCQRAVKARRKKVSKV